jgi:hypothetical protein
MPSRRLGALVAMLALGATSAAAQAHRPRPPAPAHVIPMAGTLIEWSVFVSAYGDAPSSRTPITESATPLTLPAEAGWSCTVGVPTRAAIDTEHWSEVRALECRRGDAILSTTGFCQVVGASWGARAAVLSLGSTTSEERVQITVDCTVRN